MSIHTIMERMVILYLDDDHDDLEILVEILAADGVSIFTFSDRDAFFNGLHVELGRHPDPVFV